MNRQDLYQRHWSYYLMLEKRFIDSIEFVSLHEENYSTFSNGYALLIQAIGAELDTVFKLYCGFETSERRTVTDYAKHILSTNPEIVDREILLVEHELTIQPFKGWNVAQARQSLQWWSAFTDIKHNRYGRLQQAKLENVLNILGALYLIEMMYLKKITKNTSEIDVFDESSKLFTLRNWTSKAVPWDKVFDVLLDLFAEEGDTADKVFDV